MTTRAKARKLEADTERDGPLIPAGAACLLDERAVRRLLGIGETKFAEMRGAGEYPDPDVKLGKLNRWTVEAHNAAVGRLRRRVPGAGGE